MQATCHVAISFTHPAVTQKVIPFTFYWQSDYLARVLIYTILHGGYIEHQSCTRFILHSQKWPKQLMIRLQKANLETLTAICFQSFHASQNMISPEASAFMVYWTSCSILLTFLWCTSYKNVHAELPDHNLHNQKANLITTNIQTPQKSDSPLLSWSIELGELLHDTQLFH